MLPPPCKASPRLAFLLGVLLALGGCAQLPGAPESPAPPGFRTLVLPGRDGATLQALERGARVAPLRYRVVVVPGSGCAGMGAFAGRYFAGLLHAQVLVLHKPGVDPQARTAPGDCASGFVQQDRLSAWLAHARAALQADALRRQGEPPVPQLLVGISEGAELLPALAPEVPRLAGLVRLPVWWPIQTAIRRRASWLAFSEPAGRPPFKIGQPSGNHPNPQGVSLPTADCGGAERR